MASNGCGEDRMRELQCRNGQAALHLKFVALILIFFTSVLGISSPVLLARQFQGKPTYAKILLLIKCFAAGVILSTSLVHVLPEAFEALADCQIAAHHPWKNFPFSGFVAMLGALLALLVDIAATAHAHNEKEKPHYIPIRSEIQNPPNQQPGNNIKKPAGDEMELGASCHEAHRLDHHHYQQQQQLQQVDDQLSQLKERLVSQVLEIGIVFHSVIIGVTMGMSQNQCTIRPLVAALAFHQIFEGMGLGGCIAQAGFNVGTTIYMCLLFSVTTPVGIVVGMLVFFATGYDDSSPNALIWEGLLGSLSSGILIYMALVDLIAVDFFHNKKMSCNLWMKKVCYIALLLGSASMSILALWA